MFKRSKAQLYYTGNYNYNETYPRNSLMMSNGQYQHMVRCEGTLRQRQIAVRSDRYNKMLLYAGRRQTKPALIYKGTKKIRIIKW